MKLIIYLHIVVLAAFLMTAAMSVTKAFANEAAFDEKQWLGLVEEHSQSPCIKNRTPQCLLVQIIDMKSKTGSRLALGKNIPHSEDKRADQSLVNIAINYSDPASARKLLTMLPDDADELRIPILFAAGEHEEALKTLHALQKTRKNGEDYNAIWALVQRGDLDKAFALAKTLMKWKYIDFNMPLFGQVRSVSGFCVSNITSAYPRSIGILAKRLADNKDYDQSYEIVQMLVKYWDNKLNGRGFLNCNWNAARMAYEDAAFGLAEALAKNGETDRARAIFTEIQTGAQRMGISPLLVVGEMRNNGFEKEAAAFALDLEETKMREREPEDILYEHQIRQEHDKKAIVMSMAGEYAQVIQRVENLPYPNIRVNTFLKLARNAAREGETETLSKILDHLMPFMGQRSRPVDNALDYIDLANMLFDAGRKEESKAALQEALRIEDNRKKGLFERSSLGGSPTLLFAKLGDFGNMKDALEYNFNVAETFTSILDYFAHHDRWDDFDSFLSEYTDIFKKKAGGHFGDKFYTPERLVHTLMLKKQFGRYLKMAEAIDSPAFQHRKSTNLVTAGFQEKFEVPDALFADMWIRHLKDCKNRKEPTAEKKMIGCYMDLVAAVQSKNKALYETRGSAYKISGH